MYPFITFGAASDLSDVIDRGGHDVEQIVAHRSHPVGTALHWVGSHLHLPHRHQSFVH